MAGRAAVRDGADDSAGMLFIGLGLAVGICCKGAA